MRRSVYGKQRRNGRTKGGVYSDTVVRLFALAAVIYGVVGMLVGVIIAAQLTWPELNFGISFLSYGRLRPLHTNAVIFAFGGCALFATSYHVVQRTCQTRLFAPGLAMFTFWAWNLVIVAAVITLPMGLTQGKEYAELEWPIDLLIAVTWVSYAIVFFGTVGTARSSTSTWPTGSSAPSSSPWRCCTSSTARPSR
jgi:cytochrome c oxidase cbb3-type subunit 1